ncbi:MAG: hypothetical protein IPN34_07340 [Planctomycetes bacterium]|nr:hypothetical protein [Planctomycetota bacterium]
MRVPRLAAAWLSFFGAALALLLAGCSGEDRPDGGFRVERSKGARSERVEPGRAPSERPSGDAARSSTSSGARGAPAAAGTGAGLTWTIPEGFVREAVPAAFSGLYLDFCRAPKQGAETHDGIVVSSVIAGTIEANLERWKGQFEGGKVVREGSFELPVPGGAALRGALLEIEGPAYAMRGSLWSEGPPSPIRAIFAAIEGPSGLLTLRYVGPPAGGERAAASFRALLDSVRRVDSGSGGGGK